MRSLRLALKRKKKSRPRFGNLRTTKPFSSQFGYDRGQPIDNVANSNNKNLVVSLANSNCFYLPNDKALTDKGPKKQIVCRCTLLVYDRAWLEEAGVKGEMPPLLPYLCISLSLSVSRSGAGHGRHLCSCLTVLNKWAM